MYSIDDIITGAKAYYPGIREERLRRAYQFSALRHAPQQRASGEPFITHPVEVAMILTSLEADEDSLIAAILHDTIEDTSCTPEDVEREFGPDVRLLVEGVTKIRREQFSAHPDERKLLSFRKTFAIMARDIRCIVIKLADRLHNMRTIRYLSFEKQKKKAAETIEVFVPLAEKLNLWEIKKELLNLSIATLEPDKAARSLMLQQQNLEATEAFAFSLQQKIMERSKRLQLATAVIRDEISFLYRSSLETSRTTFDPAETHTIRCVVETTQQCYQLLYLLHEIFRVQPNAVVDYITTPKYNGYQAIHTVLLNEHGQSFFVQILSLSMAKVADRGITAFWKGNGENLSFKRLREAGVRLKWLEDIKYFTKDDSYPGRDLTELIQKDFLQRQIFVFDEDRRIYDLPKGATVLDFLYNYKSEKAGYAFAALVNNREVPLHTVLQEQDKIEARYGTVRQTRVEWLQSVRTYFAKRKIQSELEKNPRNEKVKTGERLLQQQFDDHNKGILTTRKKREIRRVVDFFSTNSLEELLEYIGTGKLSAEEVFRSFFPLRIEPGYTFSVWLELPSQETDTSVTISKILQISSYKGLIVEKTVLRSRRLYIQGRSAGNEDFDRFVQSAREEGLILSVRQLLTAPQRLILIAWWAIVVTWFLVAFLFANIVPQKLLLVPGGFVPFFIYTPSIFALVATFVSMKTLRNQIRWMRPEQRYILASLVVNGAVIAGNALLYLWWGLPFDLSIFLGIYLISILISSFQYVRTSLDTQKAAESANRSETEEREQRRLKIQGYIFRIVGLIIWGCDPLVAKYALGNYNGIFVSAFSMWIGTVFVLPFLLAGFWKKRRARASSRLVPAGQNPYHPLFFVAIFFSGITSVFHFFSLNYTTASNAILFLNFAPVIALVVTLLFMRQNVPYLQDRNSTLKIVGIFLLGCVGSSFLVFNKAAVHLQPDFGQKLYGDFLAFLSLLFDVVSTIALIRYAKMRSAFGGMDFISHKLPILAVIFAPAVIPRLVGFAPTFNEIVSFLFLGLGTYTLAYYLAYEAYRRLDGLINYLLFILAPIITSVLEVLFFGLPLSWSLVVGAVCILGSTVAAEMVNTNAQKKAGAVVQEN